MIHTKSGAVATAPIQIGSVSLPVEDLNRGLLIISGTDPQAQNFALYPILHQLAAQGLGGLIIDTDDETPPEIDNMTVLNLGKPDWQLQMLPASLTSHEWAECWLGQEAIDPFWQNAAIEAITQLGNAWKITYPDRAITWHEIKRAIMEHKIGYATLKHAVDTMARTLPNRPLNTEDKQKYTQTMHIREFLTKFERMTPQTREGISNTLGNALDGLDKDPRVDMTLCHIREPEKAIQLESIWTENKIIWIQTAKLHGGKKLARILQRTFEVLARQHEQKAFVVWRNLEEYTINSATNGERLRQSKTPHLITISSFAALQAQDSKAEAVIAAVPTLLCLPTAEEKTVDLMLQRSRGTSTALSANVVYNLDVRRDAQRNHIMQGILIDNKRRYTNHVDIDGKNPAELELDKVLAEIRQAGGEIYIEPCNGRLKGLKILTQVWKQLEAKNYTGTPGEQPERPKVSKLEISKSRLLITWYGPCQPIQEHMKREVESEIKKQGLEINTTHQLLSPQTPTNWEEETPPAEQPKSDRSGRLA